MWIKIALCVGAFGLANWGVDKVKAEIMKLDGDLLKEEEKNKELEKEKNKQLKNEKERKRLDKIIESKYYEIHGRNKVAETSQVKALKSETDGQKGEKEKTKTKEKKQGGEK